MKKKINKSLFRKIIKFMSNEGFEHTDQTVDGQDIFEGKKGKVIVEIIEK